MKFIIFGAFREALGRLPGLSIFYIRAGGDDSVIMAHSDDDIRTLHCEMVNADDGWGFELKLMGDNNWLSFFDVELHRCWEPSARRWTIQTGVHFDPPDALLRTHAESLWPRVHQDALLRAHLLRITRLCSTHETVARAVQNVGYLLARRRHPLEGLIEALRRLNPQFLIDMLPERVMCSGSCSFLSPWYKSFVPPRPKRAPKVMIKMPFIGPQTPALKRIILDMWLGSGKFKLARDDVCITFVPFKCLSRLLPRGQVAPLAIVVWKRCLSDC